MNRGHRRGDRRLDRSSSTILSQYRRLLAVIVLVIIGSSMVMGIAAGGSWYEVLMIGGVGLGFGVVVAAYLVRLIAELRRR